jgi:hypothetical protein
MRWPGSTNSGTWMTAPVSSVAGLAPQLEMVGAYQGESVLLEPNIDVVAAARAFIAAGSR